MPDVKNTHPLCSIPPPTPKQTNLLYKTYIVSASLCHGRSDELPTQTPATTHHCYCSTLGPSPDSYNSCKNIDCHCIQCETDFWFLIISIFISRLLKSLFRIRKSHLTLGSSSDFCSTMYTVEKSISIYRVIHDLWTLLQEVIS